MGSAVKESDDRNTHLQQELDEARALVALLRCELAEVNHRVSNSLQLVSSLLNLQRKRLGDPAARDALSVAMARIEAVARLHRLLYRQSTTKNVDFGQYLKVLSPEIGKSGGLQCDVATESFVLDSKTAMSLAVVTNELVINASKHAYGAKPGGAVDIACRRDVDGSLLLTVADHGQGLPANFDLETAKGLGLSMVSTIACQLGGSVETASENGACFTLRVPDIKRFCLN